MAKVTSSRPNSPPWARMTATRSAIVAGRRSTSPTTKVTRPLPKRRTMHQSEDRAGRNNDQSQVDRHAHGDEEQADEDVAERAQIVFDAMPEVAAADHHAGDERADRQGEAREIGEVGGAQRHEKGRQEEQVARTGPAAPASTVRTSGRAMMATVASADRRQPETPHEIERVDRCLSRPAVHGDKEGDRRDILEQQDADGETAVLTGDFALFGELLHGDGGRRHRRGAPQQDGKAEIEPEPPQRGGDRCQRRRHLQAAGQQDVGAGGEQRGQRELQPDHEHQEDQGRAPPGTSYRRRAPRGSGHRVRSQGPPGDSPWRPAFATRRRSRRQGRMPGSATGFGPASARSWRWSASGRRYRLLKGARGGRLHAHLGPRASQRGGYSPNDQERADGSRSGRPRSRITR